MKLMTADDPALSPRHWTVDDLEHTPDDGKRYEILEGRLIVSPAPFPIHQRSSRALFRMLDRACPADLEVFYSPIDYYIAWDTSLQPDLAVMRRAGVEQYKLLDKPALLVVEIISRGSRTEDLKDKPPAYARSGAENFWTFDPQKLDFVAWRLQSGGYVEHARASGAERIRLDRPYPVEICPAEIVNG